MKAVVSGGCSGLGLYFTEELLKRGYKVYALYHKSVDNALELEDKYENVKCIKCDISNESEVENLFFNLDDIDLLINNAGIAIDNDYQNKSKKEFMKVLEVNLVGTFLMIKYGINNLKKGTIVNISSNNALDKYNELSMDYDASKCGINSITKNFSTVTNNKIVSICPGWINTNSIKGMNPEYLKECLKKDNQKELIEPDKLVNNILNNLESFNTGDIIEMSDNDGYKKVY